MFRPISIKHPHHIIETYIRHITFTFGNQRTSAQRKKSIHAKYKQLFGPVIKNDVMATSAQFKETEETPEEIKKCSSDIASEVYWLTKHTNTSSSTSSSVCSKSKMNKKSTATSKKLTEPIAEKTNAVIPQDKSIPKTVHTTKDVIRDLLLAARNSPNTSPTPKPIPIPFNENELKEILKYPMNCEKSTSDRIKEIQQSSSAFQIPSISKVLQGTMPEPMRIVLKKWKLAKISELGEDGFQEFQQQNLNMGSMFHGCLEKFLISKEVPDSTSPVYNLWQSVDKVLSTLEPKPLIIEKPILHPDLKYKGIIDCVSVIRDTVCLLEWKTSDRQKQSLQATFDAPLQMCAYLGALNIDPRYDIQSTNGLLVIAYKNGSEARTFYLSDAELRKYWKAWLLRLQEYWIRARDGTILEPV